MKKRNILDKLKNSPKFLRKVLVFFIVTLTILVLALNLFVVPGIGIIGAQELVLGAHRGNSIDYIENTIPAFKSAVENPRYKFIEFDVLYTKDKQLVVHHDLTLLRLQKKMKKIGNLNYSELMNLSDYHIPTYEEVMEIVSGEKPLNIEIKSQGNFTSDKEMVNFLIADCTKRGILNSTLISSVSSDAIKYISEKYPEVKTGKIYYVTTGTILPISSMTHSLFEEMNNTNTDYLMIYGTNLRNYHQLIRHLPNDKTLVIWYFTDEMYILSPKKESWVYKLRMKSKEKIDDLIDKGAKIQLSPRQFPVSERCVWWC
ncbi:MAG: glycerophosphodiester phosphodiesterase family protein [Nanoarchaeota archaeon]|nr:glycerophosphodiester phosphodiesterase family protein [Nanoarchaeota archaeon]